MGGFSGGVSGGGRAEKNVDRAELLQRLREVVESRTGRTSAETEDALKKLQKAFSLSETKFTLIRNGIEHGEDPALMVRSIFPSRIELTKKDRLKEPENTKLTGINLRGRAVEPAKAQLEAIKNKRAELIRKMTFGFEVSLASIEMDRAERGGPGDYSAIRSSDRDRLEAALVREIGAEAASKWDVATDMGTLEIRPPVLKMESISSSMKPFFAAAKKAGVIADLGFGGYNGGGGHIHIGRNIFDENPLLLRNLLVEIYNRPYIQAVFEELADDQALSIRQRGQMAKFKQEVDAVDRLWSDTNGALEMPAVLDALRPLFGSFKNRYRDVNLANLYSSRCPTVEIRMHRGQSTAADCTDLSELWTYVLASLSLQERPIPISTLNEGEAATLRLPSRATALMKKFVEDTGVPHPERFERFAEQRFPQTVVKLGPAGKPDVEIRFADFAGVNDNPIYEVLVRNPSITQIQFGNNAPIELFSAPEIGEGVRIGKYVHRAKGDVTEIQGVPGVTRVDFTEARRPVDEFEPVAPGAF